MHALMPPCCLLAACPLSVPLQLKMTVAETTIEQQQQELEIQSPNLQRVKRELAEHSDELSKVCMYLPPN